MKNSIRHVEGLVIDMLYYSKDRVPERKHINMNAVILDIVEALREMAVGQGVEIRVDLDEAMSEELLDGTAIHRLIIDLVTNAVDACTESETGSLVIVKTRVSPKEIVLTVKDDGIGMSDAVRENLFTRLFSTKAAKGTGLGMPVINKLTKEHDGTINVESIPGKGSAFHIHFPRSSNAGSHVQSDDDA